MSEYNRGRASVLVVDDEPDIREMLCSLLDDEGYEAIGVEGGVEALSAARRRRFDLAMIDLRMPGMSGRELLSALRVLDPNTRVLVVSAYATREESEACMALGALAVVSKPVDVERLVTLVDQALGRPARRRVNPPPA
jgi:DNA-binding NtrC family response regulator